MVTFTEEILNGKLHFLGSVMIKCKWRSAMIEQENCIENFWEKISHLFCAFFILHWCNFSVSKYCNINIITVVKLHLLTKYGESSFISNVKTFLGDLNSIDCRMCTLQRPVYEIWHKQCFFKSSSDR